MQEIYRNRLLKLADFLDTVPPERFDYARWVGESWQGDPDLSCGTTACALGWASTIPEFRKLGLRLKKNNWDLFNPTYVGLDTETDEDLADKSSYLLTLEASKYIFGLSNQETNELFTPEGYAMYYRKSFNSASDATASDVAQHIRNFCRDKSET